MRILRLWLTEVGVKTKWLVAWRLAMLVGVGFFSLISTVRAQNVCINPAYRGEFTIDKQKVCVGEAVNITAPPNIVNVGYYPFYNGNGIPVTTSLTTSYTYSQPGSYTIIQVGSGAGVGTGTIACKEVIVLPNEPIKFTAKVCFGRKVLVDVALDAKSGLYDNYIINWGDGQVSNLISRADIVKQQSHTYNNDGPQTIKVYGESASGGCRTSEPVARTTQQTVTISSTSSQPVITKLTTVSDNSITLQYQAGTGAAVELFRKNASGAYETTYQKGTGSGIFTINADAKQTQCFQLGTQDGCNSADGPKSAEVCSLVLEAKAANKQNDLNWQPYAGAVTGSQFRYYRVLRDGVPVGGTLTNRTTTSYSDNNKIECGVKYCYTLEATIAGAAQTVVTSAPVCVTGINGEAPGEFRNIVVSIENNRPRIVATLPTSGTSASYTLVVSRANGPSGSFQQVSTVTNRNTFIDETVDPSAGPYCYQLTYLSNCGQTSPPSKPVCTVFLTSKSSASIDWTTDSPFSAGAVASYTVEVIDSVNGTKREIPRGGNVNYLPDPNDPNVQSQKYRIVAVSSGGVVSYSNFYTLRREAKILIPDAFTPNGDTDNPTFVPKGIYFDQFSMTIYDRWGSVLYHTTDKTKGWDGTANGQPMQPGQYMYRIEVKDMTGQKTVRTGALLLIR